MYGVALLTAGITAYYMFRLFFITFLGSYRGDVEPARLGIDHAPGWVMGLPVALLIVPSVLAGWLLFPMDGTSPWARFFASQFPPAAHPALAFAVPDWATSMIALGVVLLGIGVAAARYATSAAQANAVARLRDESLRMPKLLANAFYVDALIDIVFVRGARLLGSVFGRIVDPYVIDAAVRETAVSAQALGSVMRALQSGLVRAYAFVIAVGVGCFLVYYFVAGAPR